MVVASLFEDLLDQYQLEQHIAEKRYTDLYLAYDIDDDRPVWIDIVRDSYATDGLFVDRLINRARALTQIRHPNIAQVLHTGRTSQGAPYVVQAVVDGYPLTHRLEQLARRSTPANPIYVLKLVRQLVDALLLAERLEIFHYDLQPDNILLKNVALPTDDTVVLIDLFIPPERDSRTVAGDEASRRAYLSPEQRHGREITAASQVYSLGVILYRLLAGKLPGRPVTMGSTAAERLLGRTTALERERPGLAPVTYRLVDRSLRKDPRGRYPTIDAFAADLDSAMAAEGLHLGSAAGAAPASRKSQAWLVMFLALALFLAAGAVALHTLRGGGGRTQVAITSPPTVAAVVMTGEATATLTPTPVESIAAAERTHSVTVIDEESTPTTRVVTSSTELNETPAQRPSPVASSTPKPTAQQPSVPAATPEPEPPRVRVIYNLVNLRRGPGVTYALMGSVRGGEILEVVAWNNDRENPWYLVITSDQRIGWIASAVVEAENAGIIASVPVAATLPAAPVATPSPEPTKPSIVASPAIQPTVSPGDPGSEGRTPPAETPTSPPTWPTLPPIEVTSTPMPLPTEPSSP